jgi:hypothetical protein
MALVLTQPLTEMSTRNLRGGKERTARGADNLNAICLENMVASTSRLLQGYLYVSSSAIPNERNTSGMRQTVTFCEFNSSPIK